MSDSEIYREEMNVLFQKVDKLEKEIKLLEQKEGNQQEIEEKTSELNKIDMRLWALNSLMNQSRNY